MSDDRHVTKYLIEVLEDGSKGFESAADKLADTDRAELAPRFRQWGQQRAAFSAELEQLAAAYGDDIDENGSIKGTLHRGWMAVKDALAGSDPDGVLDAAVQGEDHAVEEYDKALGHDDLSANLRQKIAQQRAVVIDVRDQVKALQSTA